MNKSWWPPDGTFTFSMMHDNDMRQSTSTVGGERELPVGILERLSVSLSPLIYEIHEKLMSTANLRAPSTIKIDYCVSLSCLIKKGKAPSGGHQDLFTIYDKTFP